MTALLITQCLQNDFTKLINKYDSIPNLLHIGYEEAKRLLGERVEEGPVNTVLDWAYHTPEDSLQLIHIRDWHDDSDSKQKDHLQQFGSHCIANSEGAEFVFSKYINPARKHFIVNASGLNDFVDTELEAILSQFSDTECRVGLMGVWTEAKISFLAYEMKTRFPKMELAVCSALCASSSRTMHFIALEQLQNILGIKIFSSIGDFTNFLTGSIPIIQKRISHRKAIQLKFSDPDYKLSDVDMEILLYLFRDAREVEFVCLDGGFSGNVVLKAKALDKLGHAQVPTVIKIGSRAPIAKERISFEKIQEVLGNNAPSVVDFAESEDRGAIKYRYAAMLDSGVKTFQKYYASMDDTTKIIHKLEIVFEKQLGRLYDASSFEKLNLLNYYEFTNRYAASVRQKVEALIGGKANGDLISLEGISIPNVCNFYEVHLQNLTESNSPSHYVSYLHGDLNGANIIVDAQENVWLIDFFHTHKGHILKDLLKLENDILFIFMTIDSKEEFLDAVKLVDILLSVEDLGELIDETLIESFQFPQMKKAFEVLIKMRSMYFNLIHADKDPYQIFVGLMRYSMHTLSFDESNLWQKKLALYAGSVCSKKILESLSGGTELRLDFIETNSSSGNMALTILPGRKDRSRNMKADLQTIKKNNIATIVCLISEIEFEFYGVEELKSEYKKEGMDVFYLPILDQKIPDFPSLEKLLFWMNEKFLDKNNILIHCVGGLGRSGTIAACYLIQFNSMKAKTAIETVRKFRSERAIETKEQEEFIYEFEKRLN